jgi:hypothetical protein
VSAPVVLETSSTHVETSGIHVRVWSHNCGEQVGDHHGVVLTWEDLGAIVAEAVRQVPPEDREHAHRALRAGMRTVKL